MSVRLLDDARVVEDALRTLAEPVKLKDIVELTKDKIHWKFPKGMTNQMNTFMRHAPTITRTGRGLYQYHMEKVGNSNILQRKGRTKPKSIIPKMDDKLEVSQESKELLEDFRKMSMPLFTRTKNTYKTGDIVEGRVTGIEEYGAFIESEDASMQGLIHITNINKHMVDDVRRHFKIGDRVTAKVISIRSKGKLSLSTKDFPLPDYYKNEVLEEKLKPIQEKLKENSIVDDNVIEVKHTNELQNIFKYMQSITGVVSEMAKEKAKELVEKEGIFKFTMALAEVKSEFEVDVSMMLAKAIEKKMSDSL